MSNELKILEKIGRNLVFADEDTKVLFQETLQYKILESALKRLDMYENIIGIKKIQDTNKKLKALEIIKKHILNRDMDTSGIYLEFQHGCYENYYTIEIKGGTKQIVPIGEYEILKEVIL